MRWHSITLLSGTTTTPPFHEAAPFVLCTPSLVCVSHWRWQEEEGRGPPEVAGMQPESTDGGGPAEDAALAAEDPLTGLLRMQVPSHLPPTIRIEVI